MFPLLKHRFIMTGISCSFIAGAITSCCMASYKCKGDSIELRCRLLSSTGNDLLFGPGRIYDSRTIQLYSFQGTDTVFHQCLPGLNPEPGKDSILYSDMEPYEKLYVKWNAADTDTVILQLKEVDASPCCPDYSVVESVQFNHSVPMQEGKWGVLEFKK